MAQISVNNLTFCYEGSFDNIFENISFSIDTNWKLGFIGRNGKGKTTFLNLLLEKYEYSGSINKSGVTFDYFPYQISEKQMRKAAAEWIQDLKHDCEQWKVICELEQLETDAEVLYRPFESLSHGERTKVMLAVLFSNENNFLLVDEPTNHLDRESREIVKKYLSSKKGFILVSHDRDLLDACIDHVLVLNRKTIEVQSGNFSSWWENKMRKDNFSKAENEKHLKEIRKLKQAATQAARWADKNEKTKIGYDPVKENDRSISTRAYIGAKTKKMQSRVKQLENRIEKSIEEKEGLLEDIETPIDLKVMPLTHHKKILVHAREYGLGYVGRQNKESDTQSSSQNQLQSEQYNESKSIHERTCEPGVVKQLFADITFDIEQGDRIAVNGKNGCGKSTLINMLLQKAGVKEIYHVISQENQDAEKKNVNFENGNEDAKRNISKNDIEITKSNIIKDINKKVIKNSHKNSHKCSSEIMSNTIMETGTLKTVSGLGISYISQDTSMLKGSIKDFCTERSLDMSLFCAVLRQLDMERIQFAKNMEEYSEGQKKKVLIAASLMTPAHLYIWDEPLNYIDVFSRMQIEKLILEYKPTMLFVEHDVYFREKIATKVVEL